MLSNCVSTVASTKPTSIREGTLEKSHGRIEKRDARVYDNLRCIEDPEWKDLIACVGVMERSRQIFNPDSKQWEKSEEAAYYICTHKITALELVTLTRNHWRIENRNHCVRDVSLGEDRNKSKNNPGMLARMRSFTLNILRNNNKQHIRQTLYENSINIERLMNMKI